MEEIAVVGKSIPRADAFEKVTGAAVYTDDMNVPGMLHGKVLRSPYPHARILNIDTERAAKLPGVKAIITADDTPMIKFSITPAWADKLPLEKDKVRFIGDEVAAVAAISEEIALEALELIKVDYEELPAVFDPVEATRPDAPRVHDNVENNVVRHAQWECGDIEQAFSEADVIVEDTFTTQSQAHTPLEGHACIALVDHSGRVIVYSSTQTPHALRQRLALVLDMPQTKIRVIKPYVGGGFGSKTDMDPIEPICVLLAQKAGKPVKIVKTREEEFVTSRLRHATISRVKMGFKKDGTLIAKEAEVIMDNGAYNSHGPAVLAYNCAFFCALYRVANVKYDGKLVYTNKPYGGAFRGYGVVQATFPQETLMDMAAEQLGIDPLDLRLKNANQPNEVTVNGLRITSLGMSECLKKAAEAVDWKARRGNLGKNRGLGLAIGLYTGGGSKGTGFNYSGASIRIDPDGTVNLLVGASDIGQGSDAVLCQIAAEALGVRAEDIRITAADTNTTPMEFGTFGSRVTFCVGNAVVRAANGVKKQLFELASEMLGAKVEDLELKDGKIYRKGAPQTALSIAEIAAASYYEKERVISASGFYNGPHYPKPDPVTYYGYPGPCFTTAAHIAEVEVDRDTGQVRVLNFVAAHDIGKVINPMSAEGQVEGGVAQGIGLALTEALAYEGGKVLNPNFTDYRIPAAPDMPPVTVMFVDTWDPNGPFGAKGLGESPMIPVAAAIGNAIYNAVGVRIKDLPMTSEKILKALKRRSK